MNRDPLEGGIQETARVLEVAAYMQRLVIEGLLMVPLPPVVS